MVSFHIRVGNGSAMYMIQKLVMQMLVWLLGPHGVICQKIGNVLYAGLVKRILKKNKILCKGFKILLKDLKYCLLAA